MEILQSAAGREPPLMQLTATDYSESISSGII
jgi:hypothetical protein